MSLNQFSLADVCSIKHGYAFKGQYFSDSITKEILLTPGNFNIGGGFKKDKLKYYNGPIDKNYILKPYDLIVTMTDLSKDGDTLGFSALVPEDNNIYLHNQRIGLVENINEKIIDKNYLYWLLRNPEYHHYVVSSATGTTVKHTSPKTILKYEFELPSIQEQNFIGQLLTNIELKIELNKKINKNLEQLINTIFYNWFISFDKFKNLKFKNSELGDIPEEWNCGILRDILTLIKNPIKAAETNGLPYLPIDIIPMNSLGISELKSDEEANSSLITFDKNDILIGAMRVYFHRVVISPCFGVTRSTCFVLKPKKKEYLSYLLLLCNLDQTIQYAQNTSKGTTMPYAVWDNGLGDMDIIIPPDNVLKEFHVLVFPIIEKIRDSYNEINKLQKLRDTLLPKLMSGEIDVSKINCDMIIDNMKLTLNNFTPPNKNNLIKVIV